MARIEPADSVKALVRSRYERICALCGAQDAVDVAHLYEDARIRKATSDRLVLLCPTHNQAQARSHPASARLLPGSFDPSVLQAEGLGEYRKGNFPLSYAKARLAAYLFETGFSYSRAVDCLTEAISAIRPLRWGDWLAASMKEVGRLCGQHSSKIGPGQRWLFLDRVALVLYDYCRWEESIEVLLASIDVSKGMRSNPYNPGQRDSDRANSFRRQSLIKASTDKLDRGQNTRKLLANLDETAQDFLRLKQYDAFATTLDVARKIAVEVDGDREKAHRLSERALQYTNKISHKWVLQEHLASEAAYFHSKGDSRRAQEHMREAMLLYSRYPVILEPVLGTTGPKKHGVHEEVRAMGMTYETLVDGSTPIAPKLQEISLALSKKSLQGLVRDVLRRDARM